MFGKKRNLPTYLQQLLECLKRLIFPKPEPEDPYAYRIAPVKRPPRGRSGAAAIEIEEE